ncbi:hypothetical protein BSKO_05020 [Bryopsis sp. KO-2023]|nr:hypothetical protein BSKO_05020 [Bryopsis sp. KO-2023]
MRKPREVFSWTVIVLATCLQSAQGLPTSVSDNAVGNPDGSLQGLKSRKLAPIPETNNNNKRLLDANGAVGDDVGDESAWRAVVSTPLELRGALERPEITSILVDEDLALRWYNGWDGGSLYGGNVISRSTGVNISSAHSDRRVEVDVGGHQLLGSFLVLDGITLTLNRLVLKNVMPVQKEALEQDVGGSRIVLHDSIVHIQAPQTLLSDIASIRSLQPGYSNSSVVPFKPGTCQMHDLDIDCPDGGWYGENYHEVVGWGSEGEGGAGAFEFTESFVAMEKSESRVAHNPAEFRKFLKDDHLKSIFVDPLVNTMDMTKTGSCSPDHPTTTLDHDLILDGRMGIFKAIFLAFNRTENCMRVGSDVTLHIRDTVIDDSVAAGELNKLVPFFKMSENSRLTLEAVVISVIPTTPDYSLKDVEKELRSVTNGGADLNITEASLESFYISGTYIKNSFQNPDTSGLILEQGTIQGEGEFKGTVDLIYSFFIIDDSLFPSETPHHRKSTFLVWLLTSIVCGIALVGYAFIELKKRREASSSKLGLYERLSTSIFGESGEEGSCETDEEELTIMSRSPADVGIDQEHQMVAEKLLEDLTLGNLIGRGAFGQVYKAMWNGAVVAVKVIFHRQSVISADEDIAREAALSSDLRHPNVVQTFMQATRVVSKPSEQGPAPQQQKSTLAEDNPYLAIHEAFDPSADASTNVSSLRMVPLQSKETWLVQEYCDLGSLGHSLKLKLLDRGGRIDMDAVLATCSDIARGMQYLHSRNVIHGDLKCTNVLLCSSIQDSRGLFAKVADFGLSRQMDMDVTHISTNTVGTLTHMPPELLKGRKLVPKGDVYSFGIMMWEIVMGRSPFEGWTAPQLLRAVLNHHWKPTFPNSVPYGYSQLGLQCLSENPQDRPSFVDVLRRLEKLRELEGGGGGGHATGGKANQV